MAFATLDPMRKSILLLALLAGACGKAPAEVAEPVRLAVVPQVESGIEQVSVSMPVVLPNDHLTRLLLVGPGLYSGAQPVGPEAFSALRELGVKTLVCVDGARPDIEAAASEGLTYIHVPIGYDGIDERAGDTFFRIMIEADLPVYFHCHHGKHRGPAAAAVALRAATGCDAATALQVLELAGTSLDYAGLWRDVEAWTPPRPDKRLPELLSVARVADFAAGMAEVDRTWDRIKDLRRADWQTPTRQPDLSLLQETRILVEQIEDCAGQIPAEHLQDRVLHRGMEEVLAFARRMQEAAERDDRELLEQSYRDLRATCTDCHHDYRDR